MVNISILAVYKTSISIRIVAENGLGWVHHYTDELLEELINTIVNFIRLFLFENGLCQITRFVNYIKICSSVKCGVSSHVDLPVKLISLANIFGMPWL